MRENRVGVLLYPGHVDIGVVRSESATIRQLLEEFGVNIESRSWDGTVEGLRRFDKPSMVRIPNNLSRNDGFAIASACKQHGHLCFQSDHLVTATTIETSQALRSAVRKFIGQHLQRSA